MKILVITSVFPNSKQPTLGVFVRERMFNVAKHCELKVIAPVPWFPFVRFIKKGYREPIPYLEIQEGIEVYHPKFFNIPKFFKFMDGFFFFISMIITVMNLRKNFEFDIIDAHFVYPDGFGAICLGKFLKKPVTITVRGTIGKLSRYPLHRLQIQYALRKAVKVFTVCKALKEAVVELGNPQEKVTVIPNGVDIEKFHPIEKVKARKEIGLPIDRAIMISVGGLVERKGFHKVIAVLPEIKKFIPEIMYVIVGGASIEGNYEPTLRKMVRDLNLENDVFFTGHQPHDVLFKWLSASDIFCLATSNEGWANVFLEAMACGIPVVTTRVGGNEEVVISEEYGLLFRREDKQEMIDTILKALKKDWDREKIVCYARSNTWDKRIHDLLNNFRDIINPDKSYISAKVVTP